MTPTDPSTALAIFAEQTDLVERLCDAVDREAEDIGGESSMTVLRLLGPHHARAKASLADIHAKPTAEPFQQRVQPWLMACFGEMIAGDREERNHRFLEEALELVQACGCTASEAHQLVDYVFGRPIGQPGQEVGGVMVTLAALCLAHNLDMHGEAETELARIWTKVAQIRAKQAAKPKYSPLPEATLPAPSASISEAATVLVQPAGVAASDLDAGKIGPGHVCKHNVRWPHPCDDCDAAAPPAPSPTLDEAAIVERCAMIAYRWWDGEPEDAEDLRAAIRREGVTAVGEDAEEQRETADDKLAMVRACLGGILSAPQNATAYAKAAIDLIDLTPEERAVMRGDAA
ncbi:hypothetical protein [Sphingomonas solaris]|uniref:hypothetical protein n=1 Tax=Alterirhizorhabdus solaris TaxID=2529389 RepID=UPI00193A3136|nr:hypothetical protein [Sphingomonas solaris]